MKYMGEFLRALKTASFLALGIFFGAGILPWIMEDDKIIANQRLMGTIWGVLGAFAAAVALMFINEILRTKRLAKKAAKAQKPGRK